MSSRLAGAPEPETSVASRAGVPAEVAAASPAPPRLRGGTILRAPSLPLEQVGRVGRGRRTSATVATFLAVGAIVFDLVMILLSRDDTRILLGGAITAVGGLVVAIASLAIPGRTP